MDGGGEDDDLSLQKQRSMQKSRARAPNISSHAQPLDKTNPNSAICLRHLF